MTASIPGCRPALLLALLAAVLVALPQAAVIEWAVTPLAFDSPAVQIVEQVSSEPVSYTDPLVEASASFRTALAVSERLPGGVHAAHRVRSDLGAVDARAPPFA